MTRRFLTKTKSIISPFALPLKITSTSNSSFIELSSLDFSSNILPQIENNLSSSVSLEKLVKITYTRKITIADAWINDKILTKNIKLVGFDTETRPNFRPNTFNHIAVFQLCVLLDNVYEILIAHCIHFSDLGKSKYFIPFFNDKEIMKLGVNVTSDGTDLSKYFKTFGLDISVNGTTSIETLSTRVCFLNDLITQNPLLVSGNRMKVSNSPAGLQTCCQMFLQINLLKQKDITMSDWEVYPLSLAQITYAAMDSWAGLVLKFRLDELIETLTMRLNNDVKKIDQLFAEEMKFVKIERDKRREEKLQKAIAFAIENGHEPPKDFNDIKRSQKNARDLAKNMTQLKI